MHLKIFDHTDNFDNTAIEDRFGVISYSGLKELVDRYASLLAVSGCRNKRVLLEGGNHRHLIALLLAMAGNDNEVFIQEIKCTATETEEIIEDYLINYSLHADTVAGLLTDDSELPLMAHNATAHFISRSMLYYLSSGSTGKPKVFGFSQEQLADLLKSWYTSIHQKADEIVLCPLTITHFHGTVITFSALINNNKLILCHCDHLDVKHLAELIDKYRPTIMSGTPYHYQKLLAYLAERAVEFKGFMNMRFAFCGSAPLSKPLADKFYTMFGINLYQGYGLSEIGVICIDTQPGLGTGTVGKVIPGVEYHIVDETGHDVPSGVEGELIVRAPYMTNGYLQQEELTRLAFRNGWLHTGDIVSEDAIGRIVILGRKSQFINIAGLKVYPAEIEKAIVAWDPGISAAISEEEEGGRTIITAYIESRNGHDKPDLGGLKDYLARTLANYKQPTRYILVDELPKNSVGKIRYHKIYQQSQTTHS